MESLPCSGGGPEFSTLASLGKPRPPCWRGFPALTGSFRFVLLIVLGEGNGWGRGTWTWGCTQSKDTAVLYIARGSWVTRVGLRGTCLELRSAVSEGWWWMIWTRNRDALSWGKNEKEGWRARVITGEKTLGHRVVSGGLRSKEKVAGTGQSSGSFQMRWLGWGSL